jgi:FkbM family methyltransferase
MASLLKPISIIIRKQPFYLPKLLFKKVSPYLFQKKGDFILELEDFSFSTNEFPDLLTRHLLFFGRYQEDVINSMKSFLKSGDTVFDIGGHHGLMSIFASNLVGDQGRVVSFEPNPEMRPILQKNLTLNNITNVLIEPIGLFDQEDNLEFYPQQGNVSWNSSFIKDFVDRKSELTPIIVPTTTLDNYVEKNQIIPNFIKIDAEGAEIFILNGAKKTIQTYHPILVMEFNALAAEKAGTSIENIVAFLENENYEFHIHRKPGLWWLVDRPYEILEKYDLENKKDLENIICLPPSTKK